MVNTFNTADGKKEPIRRVIREEKRFPLMKMIKYSAVMHCFLSADHEGIDLTFSAIVNVKPAIIYSRQRYTLQANYP